MIAVRGYGSRIAQEFAEISTDDIIQVPRDGFNAVAQRHLFCQGVMRAKSIGEQSAEEIAESWRVNATMTIDQCDEILRQNERARICVIGSESGFTGSFDGAYAAAKAAVHRYVETRRMRTAHQQLICIAPGIIGDAGMTTRRNDHQRLVERRMQHPKGRFVTAREVAALIHHVLYVDEGYLSGVVIRMNGGEHTR